MAATLSSSQPTWKSRPSYGDIGFGICITITSVLTGVVAGSDIDGHFSPDTWVNWVLVALPSVAVIWRRTATLPAAVVSVLSQAVVWVSGLASATIGPLVMVYTLRAHHGTRYRAITIAMCAGMSALALVGVFVAPDVGVDDFCATVLTCIAAYVLGATAANREAEATAMASKLATAEATRENERQLVAAQERSRIARELHDIVGHSLSVIAVRAEAADRVAANNPEAPAEAVSDIAITARSSLAEVRRVLAGMRDSDSPELAPVPSVGTIPELVRTTTQAGVATNLSGALPPDEQVGPAVGAGAYRIVQEALTNVVKHAGPNATAQLTLELEGNQLLVRVDDDGRGPSPTDPEAISSGLTGMAERVGVLGGSFDSGARPGGGFRVEARLPLNHALEAPAEAPTGTSLASTLEPSHDVRSAT